MSFSRAAFSALFTGSLAATAIIALVLSGPEPADESRATLPRFVIHVSTGTAKLLVDQDVTDRLDLVAAASSDTLEEDMARLDADGVIVDRATLTQMTSAGIASLLRSGRVVVTIGAWSQEVMRLAGLDESLNIPAPSASPFFSILVNSETASSATNMDYSSATFTGLLSDRANRTRAGLATPATATPTRAIP